jgi:glycosyltransferase involved in cell wall biosynthesis
VILIGHPTGNPNSHQAALAHYEAGRLEAFCVPWMPTPRQTAGLRLLPGSSDHVSRLERRAFEPLLNAPHIEGHLGEWTRMLRRMASGSVIDGQMAQEANEWLMRTMRRECRRPSVSAVHCYTDCAWWPFEEAQRLGKASIYDMPTPYHAVWEQTKAVLASRYADWLPDDGLSSGPRVQPEQKRREIELADLVLAPSAFVRDGILQHTRDKNVALAPYGVDQEFWRPREGPERADGEIRFLHAGQCSVQKGIPALLQAWETAGLKSARLDLVGLWQLARSRLRDLPKGVTWTGPLSQKQLRQRYHDSDVLVLATFFEGRALVVGEALASGLPVLTTTASGIGDLVDDSCGRLVQAGNLDELVAALRFFTEHRDRLPALSVAARTRAKAATWGHYRRCVNEAVAGLNL